MRPKYSSFGLPPGLWRLVWFGRFAKPAVANQLPALNAFFRRQLARPAANTRLADASASDLFKTTIPVAQLVHFPLLTSIDVAPTVLPGTGSVNGVLLFFVLFVALGRKNTFNINRLEVA